MDADHPVLMDHDVDWAMGKLFKMVNRTAETLTLDWRSMTEMKRTARFELRIALAAVVIDPRILEQFY